MKKSIFLGIILGLSLQIQAQFVSDELGQPFISKRLEMGSDYSGPVSCTFIKTTQEIAGHKAILYVHGYNDYFFQREMALYFESHGYAFYAVDLRKYGRSILSHQTPFEVHRLEEYYADIDTALQLILNDGKTHIALMGHSTGGLITSLYCHENRGDLKVHALVLNSPFLDFNFSPLMETMMIPLVSFWGSIAPRSTVPQGMNSVYGESVHALHRGEWHFDRQKKLIHGAPIQASWVRAIHKGHRQLQKGLAIPCPVLVLCSDSSYHETFFSEEAHTRDAVLSVEDIQKYGPGLSRLSQVQIIPQGKHDLALSYVEPRQAYFQAVLDFLKSSL